MKTRNVIPSDLETLADMVADWDAPITSQVKADPLAIAETLVVMAQSPMSVCVAAVTEEEQPVGVASAVVTPMWFNREWLHGQEMFWYVHPEHRRSKAGKLLFNALEGWAKDIGAQSFGMASLHSKHQKRVNRIYEQKGYTALETVFIKEL